MQKIFNAIRAWLLRLADPGPRPDISEKFTSRDWADLPNHHPRCPE